MPLLDAIAREMNPSKGCFYRDALPESDQKTKRKTTPRTLSLLLEFSSQGSLVQLLEETAMGQSATLLAMHCPNLLAVFS